MLSAVKDENYLASPIATFPLLALPWLNPLTYGPTHAVVQGIAVWLCAALCCIVWELVQLQPQARTHTVSCAWLLAGTSSACIGLLQYLGYAQQFSPWVNYVDAGQAYANLRQRNQQGTLLAIGYCALLWWQCQAPEIAVRKRKNAWHLVFFGATALLLSAADAAAGSRTGLLQLLLLLALALLWRRGRAAMALALLAYALASVVLPQLAGLDPLHSGILGRANEASSPCSSRLTLWSNVLHLIAQKPWTGWGWGELDYAHFMTLYSGPRFCEILGNAHNLPLHLAVELGVPFSVLVCGAALWLVVRARPWREQDATRQMAWSVLAVIGLHSLLEYPLWYGPFQVAALLAVWMLWQSRSDGVTTAGNLTAFEPSGLRVALATAVLLACSYTAWDYWRISQIYLPVAQRDAAYRDNVLEKIRPSRLFADQVKFAELGITPLTADNAAHIHALALEMLHFSPEASVVAKVIESARLLGQDDAVAYYSQRFEAAYPQEYVAWRTSQNARVQAP